MAWVDTSGGGISGEMIRDMMLDCVEQRFEAIRAPKPVQWLADNGSAYTAGETIDFAVALNLVACFPPEDAAEARELTRRLVEEIRLVPGYGRLGVEVRGALGCILRIAEGARGGAGAKDLARQVKLVAGTRYQRSQYVEVAI